MTFSPYDPSAGKTYPQIKPQDIARVEIFPPVGIARVGDSGSHEFDLGRNRESQYFYGPEVPGIDDHPFGNFRDERGGIKRQAARFRVYAYGRDGNVLGEINAAQGYQLKWTVHVANKKGAYYLFRGRLDDAAVNLRNPDVDNLDSSTTLTGDPFDQSLEARTRLIIDPGEKTIELGEGRVMLDGKFQGTAPQPISVNLGELRVDERGRLVFLGGSGRAFSLEQFKQAGGDFAKISSIDPPEIISGFNSVDWFDDVCDGWVDVSVSHPTRPAMSEEIPKPHKATVLSAPPKFAWGIDSPTTLYDIFEDFYSKENYVDHPGTDFYKDIWPVLYGTYKLSWVNNKAFQGHGPGGFGEFATKESKLFSTSDVDKPLRERIFKVLREPDYKNEDQASVKFMPRLSGDEGDAIEPGDLSESDSAKPIQRFAALTALQYARFENWKDGKFDKGQPRGKLTAIEDYPVAEQTQLLARAMLEQTIGDPLFPGIESFWIAKCKQTYDFSTVGSGMHPPFRVDHKAILPGFLTRGLALPWQSDFDQCESHWWPSARPDDVVLSVHDPSLAVPAPRKTWARGLRVTPEGVISAFFPGSTDMVKMWHTLGFIAKQELGEEVPPAWVEQERRHVFP